MPVLPGKRGYLLPSSPPPRRREGYVGLLPESASGDQGHGTKQCVMTTSKPSILQERHCSSPALRAD